MSRATKGRLKLVTLIHKKTHKRLKERFLKKDETGQNVQIFDVIIFFKLHTIQYKTVKPTCLCPSGARKLAEGKGHQSYTPAEDSRKETPKHQGHMPKEIP